MDNKQPESNSSGNVNVIDRIKAWVSPTLLVIITFFLNKELNRIETKIDIISSLQVKTAIMEQKIDRMERDIDKLKTDWDYQQKIYGRKEDDEPPKKRK